MRRSGTSRARGGGAGSPVSPWPGSTSATCTSSGWDALAAEVGWSRKRLWSRFGAQLGVPPKRAAKLVRFDHAAHRLVAGEGAARVADQSHLHRDVVECTGVTPATLAGEPFLAVDDIAWPGRGTTAGR